jgi:hypothetical protein
MKNNINITLLENTMNIGLPEDSIYRCQIIELQKHETFNSYIITKKENNKFVSEEQTRNDFIRENNLQFVIADMVAKIDTSIQNMADTMFTDKVSGERFIILKR